MTRARVRKLVAALFAAVAVCVCVAAPAAAPPKLPDALDVPTPYLPSTRLNVDEMLRLAGVQPGDIVYDLGSGDGRVVIAAARDWGARGVGIEIDRDLVAQSRDQARREGVADRVSFREGDVFAADIGEASVVTMYLLSALVHKLEPKLLAELKPGTRIVAHDYGFAEWRPDRETHVSKNFYLYVVPARIAGQWRLASTLSGSSRVYDLDFEQRFQELRGGARVAGGFLPAFDARLAGSSIAFVLVEDDMSYRYEGRISGSSMDGVVRWGHGPRQRESTWRAVRVAAPGG